MQTAAQEIQEAPELGEQHLPTDMDPLADQTPIDELQHQHHGQHVIQSPNGGFMQVSE